jgi:hypothetical protein
MKPGEHILRGHLWHNRRRTTNSDAFSGGARSGGRLTFEGGGDHSTRENKALVGPCVRVLRSEGVPRPLSTFTEGLLSALSTPVWLFAQSAYAQQDSYSLKLGTSTISSSALSLFISPAHQLLRLGFTRLNIVE